MAYALLIIMGCDPVHKNWNRNPELKNRPGVCVTSGRSGPDLEPNFRRDTN
jgi:hypothetical protein